MIIRRERLLDKLKEKKDNGRVKIITGIRRCGKSFLLFELYRRYLMETGTEEDQIIQIQLDDVENIRYRNPLELNSFVRNRIIENDKRYYAFIDEIQLCAEIQNPYLNDPEAKVTFIDTVIGLMKIPNLDVYITGSNSKMLSSDVLTQFRDRGDEIHVSPLSFREMHDAYRENGLDPNSAWRDYLAFGGMPYVLALDSTEKKSTYLKDLFKETYIRDIVERNGIRNDSETLDILLDFVSSSVGSLTNPYKLAKRFESERNLKISHVTISRYLDMFREAYVLEQVKRYDIRGSHYFDFPMKYYFTDIGLRNARLNFRQVEENHIMENIVYNELVRRGFNVDVGVVQFSRKEPGSGGTPARNSRVQLEVDFVVNRINVRYYIQVALNVNDKEKREQETNSLNRIEDSFRKIIIVKDDIIPWTDDKGILTVSVKDFLLDDKYLS